MEADQITACEECGVVLPPFVDGSTSCPTCGLEHLASTGEFAALTERTLPVDRPSHAGEDAARIAMTEKAIVELLRRQLGVLGTVFVAPDVPARKEAAARRAHVVHLPSPEKLLALYDATMLGSGEEGFIVTTRRLCWKNVGAPACSIQWRDIDPDRLFIDGRRLFVDDEAITIDDEDVLDASMDAFHVLALSARPQASGHMPVASVVPAESSPTTSAWFARAAAPAGTPPPPHSTSYLGYASRVETKTPACKCWHCHTPLHETTPQCGYCGAIPKKKTGWLKATG
ncbi:MAG: hypothetical protein KIT84_33345 [Labilithrix sp.]|nr:hypothetical protein [Labilithrix sp.]MCW5815933.1 hypothetical protein [Labilithrix sp.]